MSEILSSVIISSAIGSASIAFFLLVRRYHKHFYMPKCLTTTFTTPDDRETLFDWVRVTLRFPKEKFLQRPGGLDGLLFLLFLKYSFWFFIVASVMGAAILLPLYKSGKNQGTEQNPVHGIDVYTTAHIEQGSNLYWITLISVFVYSTLACLLMWKLYAVYVHYVDTKLEKGSTLSRTVMVSNITDSITNDKQFKHYWESLYPHRVTHTILEPDLRNLEQLLKEKKKLEKRLEKAENRKWYHFCRRDSIEYLKRMITYYDSMIQKERSKPHDKTNVGFVTFTSTATAMQAAQTLHNPDPGLMIAEPAPDPKGLRWSSFYMSRTQRFFKSVISYIMLTLLFLFWSIPVTFVAALSNLETLSQVPFLKPLVSFVELSPWLQGFINGFLPSLALIIFLSLLPKILYAMIKIRGWFYQKLLDKQLLRTYWLFLILNVLLVFTISGSLFGAALSILEKPTLLIETLATSLPGQATFFINYIIVQTAIIHFFNNMARIPDLLLYHIDRWTSDKKKTQLVLEEWPMKRYFAEYYSKELLIFTIGLTYSSIAPMILPFVAVYFGFSFFTSRYNWVYIIDAPYEGVRMTRLVIDRIFVAVILYQFTTMGVLGLGLFPFAPAILIATIGVVVFRFYLNSRYKAPSRYLALENCPDQPEITSKEAHEGQYGIFKHPILRGMDSEDEEIGELEEEDHKEEIRAVGEEPPESPYIV